MDFKKMDGNDTTPPNDEPEKAAVPLSAIEVKSSTEISSAPRLTNRVIFSTLFRYSVSLVAADAGLLLAKWLGGTFVAQSSNTDEFTAYSTGSTAVMLVQAFGVPITIAGLSLISKAHGDYVQLPENDPQVTAKASEIGQLILHSYVPSMTYGAITVLPLCFIAPILSSAGFYPDIAQKTQTYLRAYLLGYFSSYVFMSTHRAYSALGKPYISTLFNTGGAALTIGLGHLFVFNYRMGAEGYGLAESISMVTVTSGLLIYAYRDKGIKIYFKGAAFTQNLATHTKSHIKMWLSMAGQNIIYTHPLIYDILAGRSGKTALAAWNIGAQTNNLAFLPLVGGSMAVLTLVSKEVGKGAYQNARRYGNLALAAFMLLAAMECIVLAAAPQALAQPFAPPSEDNTALMEQTKSLFYGLSVFNFIDATRVILVGGLNGYQDSQFPMWTNIIFFSMVGIPLSWSLSEPAKMGILGLLAGQTVASGLSVIANTLRWIAINLNPSQYIYQSSHRSFFSTKARCLWFTPSNDNKSSTTENNPLLSETSRSDTEEHQPKASLFSWRPW